MDKFEKILDVIDHQEKYTDAEIRELLQDEECRKLYETMQEVDSALLKQEILKAEDENADGKSSRSLNMDAEWEKFSKEHQLVDAEEATDEHHPFSWRKIAASIAGFVLISGIAFAAIHTYIRTSQEPMPIAEKTEMANSKVAPSDTTKTTPASETQNVKPAVHKTFVNVSLDKMLTEIAAYYDLQVVFEKGESKTLRLYYEWDSHTPISDVVKELNQFENVDISLHGNEIIVQ